MASLRPLSIRLRLSGSVLVVGFLTRLALCAAEEPSASAISSPPQLKNSFCLDCHADKELFKTNSTGQGISLFIEEARFKTSVHKTNSCASCHSDIRAKHPDDNVAPKPVNCSVCH